MDPLRCPTTGLPRDCAFNFPALTGGNPNLKPEESEQFTVGMVWEPTVGFSVGLDFWKINKTHVIGTLEEDTLFQNFDKFGGSNVVRGPVDPAFPNLPGPIQLVFENNQNFGNLRTSGVDLDLSYRSPQMAAGRFGFNLSGTYVHDWREQLDGVNYVSLLGSHINGVAIQRWRHYLTVNWDYGLWAATLAETFILGYTDAQLNAAGNERRVGNYEVWDVQGTYSGIRSLKIALGIKNLFDRAPPFSNQVDTFQIGYDPHYADPRGRTYYGRVTYSFK
jgi:iron complex outermembrane receptor protein